MSDLTVEVHVDIDAPPERVWPVMSDVVRWPEWTSSISKVEFVTPAPLAMGSRVRVRQPKLPPAVWTVTALEPGRSFEWIAGAPGLRSVAAHRVAARPGAGASTVTLSVRSRGFLLAFLGPRLERLTRRYVEMEAAGLKRRCEGR